jgi:DME family drug/metabolite transporter
MSTPSARLGLVQISLAGVLWGTCGLGMKIIADHSSLSSLTVSAYRMAVAAAVLIVAVLASRTAADVRELLARHRVRVALAGVCTGGYQALYFGSVLAVGVTVSTVVTLGIAPVLLTLGGAARARRAPGQSQVVVVLMALTGLVLVSGSGGGSVGDHPIRGVAEAVASGTLWALTTAVSRGIADKTPPLALTTVATSAGAVLLVPLALIGGGPLVSSDIPTVATIAYLGVFTMALAYGLLYTGLRTVEGSAAVVAALLEPVTAAVAAAFFLGEKIGVLGLVGMLLILGAVLELALKDAPAPAPT